MKLNGKTIDGKKTMNKRNAICMVMAALGVLLIGAPAFAGKTTLRVGYDLPPFTQPGRTIEVWAETVMKKSDGRIQVETYPSASIGEQKSTIDILLSGVADAMLVSFSTHRGFFPLSNIGGLPGLGFPDTIEGHAAHAKALQLIIEKYPAVAKEFKDFIILIDIPNSNNFLLSKDKLIRTPDDLKGLKIGGTGVSLQLAKVVDAAGIFCVPPLIYQQMQTGVIDIATIHFPGIKDFKLYEVGKSVTLVSWGQSEIPLVMSKRSWNKLSAEEQQIITEAAKDAQKIGFEIVQEYNKIGRDDMNGSGGQIVDPGTEEYAAWEKQFKIIWEMWVSDRQKEGVDDASKILKDWKTASYNSWKRQELAND
jgi:TRAP-type C4-dicarboxylate transport system substrate-binding protein